MRECVSSDPVDDVDDTVAGGDVTGEEGGALRGLPVAVSEGELQERQSHAVIAHTSADWSPATQPATNLILHRKLQATQPATNLTLHHKLQATPFTLHHKLQATPFTLHHKLQTTEGLLAYLHSTSQATGHRGLASNAFIVHHKHSAVRLEQ